MKQILRAAIAMLSLGIAGSVLHAAAPVVSNTRAAQRAGTHLVDIFPAGTFQMGDSFVEGNSRELPVHNVYLSAFFMDKLEAWRERWLDVHAWAIANGYSFDKAGSFKATFHPVHTINWLRR